mgnify:CR=1 FL=1
MAEAALRPKDYKSGLKPIWCPGCGHYAVLNGLVKALAALGLEAKARDLSDAALAPGRA